MSNHGATAAQSTIPAVGTRVTIGTGSTVHRVTYVGPADVQLISEDSRRFTTVELNMRTGAPRRALTVVSDEDATPMHLRPTSCYVCGSAPHADTFTGTSGHRYWSNADAAAEFAGAPAPAYNVEAAYVAQHRPY